MEVVVISREMIKPSRPTPDHIPHLDLSFRDQITPSTFMPTIFFYSAAAAEPAPFHDSRRRLSNLQQRTSNKLKKSLSENLTRFYLLAGRLRQNRFIECNDEGVEYLEAHSKSQFSDVVQDSNLGELNKLVPYHGFEPAGDLPLAIQVTFFDCGGIVIGTCFNHKISDAASTHTFMISWGASARGDINNVYSHGFDSAKLFPPRDHNPNTNPIGIINKEKIVAKRFVFDSSALSALRAKYSTTSTRPTRAEALSAFIWSRFVATTQGPKTNIYVFHIVNLRGVLNPPLPDSYFGNLFGRATVGVLSGADDQEDFVIKARDAIRRIDGDYLKQFQEGNWEPKDAKELAKMVDAGGGHFYFSSVWRFPVYESDFGWGKPIWVTISQLPLKNLVHFFPTRSGDGIEALVHLEETDMAKLEADKEFLSFASAPAKIRFLSSL